jgi:hypothetical protein
MANLFISNYINRSIMSFVLTSFCMTYAIPVQATQFQVGVNEVAFIYRLEKLV